MVPCRIIGFEGQADDLTAVTFGSVAATDGSVLKNLGRQTTSPLEDFERLCDVGAITRVGPHSPYLPPATWWNKPCYLMRIPQKGEVADILTLYMSGVEWSGRWRDRWFEGAWQYLLFLDFETLDLYAKKAAEELRRRSRGDVKSDLYRASRILDPWEGLTREEWLASRFNDH